jgi:hypothetical protein
MKGLDNFLAMHGHWRLLQETRLVMKWLLFGFFAPTFSQANEWQYK